MSIFALEHGTPGAPVLFGAEKNQLLSAIDARENDLLLGRALHVYTPFAPLGPRVRYGLSEPLGSPGCNFTHAWHGHKINEAVLQATLVLDAKVPDRFNVI